MIRKFLEFMGRNFYYTMIVLLVAGGYKVYADYAVTAGSGTTIFAFVCSVSKVCPASVPIDSAGGDMTDTTNHALKVVNPTAANFVATVQPGNTANTTPWLFSPSTGGNTAAVKAASTAPVATDPALVVAISPNSVNANGAASIANSAPVTAATINVTPTDCSISLTTGGTAQNIIAASATLHGFTISNIDTSAGSGEPVWISFTGTAAASTAGSYPLAAPTATTFANLSSYTTPLGFGVNHAISVVAATTGHKISCTQW